MIPELAKLWQDEPTESALHLICSEGYWSVPIHLCNVYGKWGWHDDGGRFIPLMGRKVIPWSALAALIPPPVEIEPPAEPRIIPDAIIPTGDDGDMPTIGPPGSLKRKDDRMIAESVVREALQWLRNDRALVTDRVASMAMRVAATEVASRLGVNLEQP